MFRKEISPCINGNYWRMHSKFMASFYPDRHRLYDKAVFSGILASARSYNLSAISAVA